MGERIDLITNGSATSSAKLWRGGKGTFVVNATWAGATITLQYKSPDGSTWISLGTDAALTANGLCGFELAAGEIRAAVTGGPPSAVYASVIYNGR